MQLKKQHIRKARTYDPFPFLDEKNRYPNPDFAPHGIRRHPADCDQRNNTHPTNASAPRSRPVCLTPRESLALNCARSFVVPPDSRGLPLSPEARALNGKMPTREECNKLITPGLSKPLGQNW